MKKIYIILLIVNFLIGCVNNPLKCDKYYQFKIPIITCSLKDTFNIGDTIWLESKFSERVAIEGGNDSIKLENFDFRSVIMIKELVNDTFFIYENPYAGKKIKILEEFDNIKSEFKLDKIEFIKYQYNNSEYFSKIYLIPQSKGFFYVDFSRILKSNAHGTPRTKVTDENNCDQYYQGVKFYINGGKNNSGHLLKGKYRFNTKVPRTEEDIWGSENQAVAFYVR